MNVDNQHEQYKENASEWAKARACFAGQRSVHALGETLLPKLGGQSEGEYKSYKERTHFTNFLRPSIEAFKGLVMREQPVINGVSDDYLADFDNGGVPLEDFAADMLEQQLTVGRVGILTDFVSSTGATTAEQAKQNGERPYTVMYTAENIPYWRKNFYVLREQVSEIDSVDEFKHTTVEKYRVLDLHKGAYRQRVFSKPENGSFTLESGIYPQINGENMDFIPFTVIGTCDEQPLMDLLNLNIAHYQLTADRRHGLHFTALPTAVISGLSQDDISDDDGTKQEFKLGSQSAWIFGNEQAKATYLEFTGQGLGEIKVEKDDIRLEMAAVGARIILSDDKKAVESAETRRQKSVGQDSVLASVARMVSRAISKHINYMNEWSGDSGDVEFALNTDYSAKNTDPAEVRELMNLYLQGVITHATLFNSLKDGDFIKSANTSDEEKDLAEIDALDEITDDKE